MPRFLLLLPLLLGLSPPALGDPVRLGGAYRGPEAEPAAANFGRRAITDYGAYWMYWFEHNKEAILEGRIRRRRASRLPSRTSSAGWFSRRLEVTPVRKSTIRGEILPLLSAALRDPHPRVRNAAAIALGKLGGPEAVRPLLRALDDPVPELRRDAMLALGLTREPAVRSTLEKVLEENRAADRVFAGLGLALLGDPFVLPLLVDAFEDFVEENRDPEAAGIATAIGLLAVDDKRASRALMTVLERRALGSQGASLCHALGRASPTNAIRLTLVTLAGSRFADPKPAATLALLGYPQDATAGQLMGPIGLKSGNRMQKLYSIWNLSRLAPRIPSGSRNRTAVPEQLRKISIAVNRDKYTAMHATLALAVAGDAFQADTWLEQLVDGRRCPVENRSALAMALGFVGEHRAVPTLRTLARRKAEDQDLRGYCLFALGLMGDRASLPLVRDILGEPRPRHQVLRSGCWSLCLLGDRADLPRLIALLANERNDPGYHHVRGAAAIAIGMLGDERAVAPLVELAGDAENHTARAFAVAALGWLLDKYPAPRLPLIYSNHDYRRVANPYFDVIMSTL